MKGWQAILIAATVMIAAAVALGMALPRSYRVERSIVVNASAESVWAQIGDLKAHEAWSPWKASDPTVVTTYGPTTTGSGAWYEWTSEDSGSGRYTITHSEPPRRIDDEFVSDSLGNGTGYLEAVPEADGLRVTWGLAGTVEGPMGGVMAMMMDRLVGRAFESGLERIKTLAETAPPPTPVAERTPGSGTEGTDPGGAFPPIP